MKSNLLSITPDRGSEFLPVALSLALVASLLPTVFGLGFLGLTCLAEGVSRPRVPAPGRPGPQRPAVAGQFRGAAGLLAQAGTARGAGAPAREVGAPDPRSIASSRTRRAFQPRNAPASRLRQRLAVRAPRHGTPRG